MSKPKEPHFDIFHIRQWQQGYTLTVDIARPNNAPKCKHTEADRRRRTASSKKNYEYAIEKRMFKSLDEVFAEINKLRFPD